MDSKSQSKTPKLVITCDAGFVSELRTALPILETVDSDAVRCGPHQMFHTFVIPVSAVVTGPWRKQVGASGLSEQQTVARVCGHLQGINTGKFFLPSIIGSVGSLPLPRMLDVSAAADEPMTVTGIAPPPLVLPPILPHIRKSKQGSVLVDPRRIVKNKIKTAPDMWKAKSWPTKLLTRLSEAGIKLNGVGFAVHPIHGYERVRLATENLDALLPWLAANFMHAEVETDPAAAMAALRVRVPPGVHGHAPDVSDVRDLVQNKYKVLRWIKQRGLDGVEWLAELPQVMAPGSETTYSFPSGLRVDWMPYKPPIAAAKLASTIEEVCETDIGVTQDGLDAAVEMKRATYESAAGGVDGVDDVPGTDRLMKEVKEILEQVHDLTRSTLRGKAKNWSRSGFDENTAKLCAVDVLKRSQERALQLCGLPVQDLSKRIKVLGQSLVMAIATPSHYARMVADEEARLEKKELDEASLVAVGRRFGLTLGGHQLAIGTKRPVCESFIGSTPMTQDV